MKHGMFGAYRGEASRVNGSGLAHESGNCAFMFKLFCQDAASLVLRGITLFTKDPGYWLADLDSLPF